MDQWKNADTVDSRHAGLFGTMLGRAGSTTLSDNLHKLLAC